MRTLLRHTRTGQFVQAPERWTEHTAQAYDFRFIDLAMQYVRTWELNEVELAFSFDSSDLVTTATLKSTVCWAA